MSDESLRLYRTMRLIRQFETTIIGLLNQGKLMGNMHLSIGQEAVAVGACDVLRRDDHIVTTHRGHGHTIAKGGDVVRMFAELFGHADGYCRGRAGSMHIADPHQGILGATAIVGGGFGMAVGAALTASTVGTDQVAVVFFGDGAVAEGLFHEALNLASLWQLPVIFICENNQYAELSHVSKHIRADIVRFAEPHLIPGVLVDGNDVRAVRSAVLAAVEAARSGGGPSLIEAATFRMGGHWEGDLMRYRDPALTQEWAVKDPIDRLRTELVDHGGALLEQQLDAIDAEVLRTVVDAAREAESGPPTPTSELLHEVYALPLGQP
jgi:TPP-dependent pyruvate/acetoin dehydrogenase alpha subunit